MRLISSLRIKIPVFVLALSATAVIVTMGIAYRESAQSSREMAESRLRSITTELGKLVAPSLATREMLEKDVAASQEVRAGLRGDTTGLRELLSRLAVPTDKGLPIQLWSASRQRIWASGPDISRNPIPVPPLEPWPAWSPLRAAGDLVLYWKTIPVIENAQPVGWIAQLRRIGDRRTAITFEGLIGDSVSLLIGQRYDSVWVDLAGNPREIPWQTISYQQALELVRPDGVEVIAWALPLSGTPWVWMAETPSSIVVQRPINFLIRMSVSALLVLVGIGLIAWAGSRRLTEPLHELANAAASVAATHYTGERDANGARSFGVSARPPGFGGTSKMNVVPRLQGSLKLKGELQSGDELGTLVQSFNQMAERVYTWTSDLENQVIQTRELASALEAENQRLYKLMSGLPIVLYDTAGAELGRNAAFDSILSVAGSELEVAAARAAAAVARLSAADANDDPFASYQIEANFRQEGRSYTLRAAIVEEESIVVRGRGICVTVEQGSYTLPAVAELRSYFGLTDREAEVALLLAGGASNKAIAQTLRIRPSTVRTHTEKLFPKLGVHSRKALGIVLMKAGASQQANREATHGSVRASTLTITPESNRPRGRRLA